MSKFRYTVDNYYKYYGGLGKAAAKYIKMSGLSCIYMVLNREATHRITNPNVNQKQTVITSVNINDDKQETVPFTLPSLDDIAKKRFGAVAQLEETPTIIESEEKGTDEPYKQVTTDYIIYNTYCILVPNQMNPQFTSFDSEINIILAKIPDVIFSETDVMKFQVRNKEYKYSVISVPETGIGDIFQLQLRLIDWSYMEKLT